ncbi:MAG: four helix bundle protein [Anaerolineales bacterium]|nr:four helix bundle protein [Anaerolineales bacterium]
MSIKNLESLETWRKSQEFALRVYRELIPLLPAEEKWGLCQQLRRSATSVPANIAEGHGRYYYQNNVRFCYNARGSLEETLSHISFCHQVKYIPENLYLEFEQDGEKLSQLLNGYINYLKRSKQGVSEPGANFAVHELQESYTADAPETDIPIHE